VENEKIMEIFRDKQQKMITELISKVLNLETQNEMLKDINTETTLNMESFSADIEKLKKENENLSKYKNELDALKKKIKEEEKPKPIPKKTLGGRQQLASVSV
jgi:hypothetical protein